MSRLPFRPLLAAAVLTSVSACDSGSEPPGSDDTFEPGCEQATATTVDPTGTYLRTNNDNASAPTVIRLADAGVAPGTRVVLERLGEYQYLGRGDASLTRDEMVGVFSTSDELLPSSQPARVPGAIRAGSNYVTPATNTGNLPTDIPEDFLIERTEVVVPAGAQFLFVGPPDNLFEDNLDADGDYRICVTPAS